MGPWGGAELRSCRPQPDQPDTSFRCDTTNTEQVHHVVYPFMPSFIGTHCAYPQGMARVSCHKHSLKTLKCKHCENFMRTFRSY